MDAGEGPPIVSKCEQKRVLASTKERPSKGIRAADLRFWGASELAVGFEPTT